MLKFTVWLALAIHFSTTLAFADDSNACFGSLPARERVAECSKLIEKNSKNVPALLERAQLNIELERYADAISDAGRVMEINPNSMLALRLRYQAQARAVPRTTLDDLNKQIGTSSQSAELYFLRSREYAKLWETRRAIDDNDRAIRLSPETVKFYLQRADLQYRFLRKKGEAFATLATAIERDPQDTSSYGLRLEYRDYDKDFVGAEADFQKILEIESRKPGNEERIAYWRRWRAVELAKYLQYEAAAAELDRVIAANPKDAEALNIRGYVKGQSKQWSAAIADWNLALAIDPRQLQALANRCAAKVAMGEFADAIRDCDEGIKLNPKNAYLFKHRGVAHLNLGQEAEGIADLDEAIKLSNSDYAAAYVARAGIYERQNKLAEAISYFELALKSTERPGNLDDITARETANVVLRRLKGVQP